MKRAVEFEEAGDHTTEEPVPRWVVAAATMLFIVLGFVGWVFIVTALGVA